MGHHWKIMGNQLGLCDFFDLFNLVCLILSLFESPESWRRKAAKSEGEL
jgi:hypothetical protein